MRDLEAVLSLLPRAREAMPREITRRDIEWLTTLHRKASDAIESHRRSMGNHQIDPQLLPHNSAARTDAEINLAGWTTRLIKNGVRDGSQKTEMSTSPDIGSILDPNWWDGLNAQPVVVAGNSDLNPSSTDWVSHAAHRAFFSSNSVAE